MQWACTMSGTEVSHAHSFVARSRDITEKALDCHQESGRLSSFHHRSGRGDVNRGQGHTKSSFPHLWKGQGCSQGPWQSMPTRKCCWSLLEKPAPLCRDTQWTRKWASRRDVRGQSYGRPARVMGEHPSQKEVGQKDFPRGHSWAALGSQKGFPMAEKSGKGAKKGVTSRGWGASRGEVLVELEAGRCAWFKCTLKRINVAFSGSEGQIRRSRQGAKGQSTFTR